MDGIILKMDDLSDSREVLQSRESPKISYFLYIFICIIAVSLVLAFAFNVDEYAKVTGKIKPKTGISQVNSPISGRLYEVNAVEGQKVNQGDLLFSLDSEYELKQKGIIENEIKENKTNLVNAQLLKRSVLEGTNLLSDNGEASSYYYQYEQYDANIKRSSIEIDKSIADNTTTQKKNQKSLQESEQSIVEKEALVKEYNQVIQCIENNVEYSGDDEVVSAVYKSYQMEYEKAQKLLDQYERTYNEKKRMYSSNNTDDFTSDESSNSSNYQEDLENAKYNYENAELDLQALKMSVISKITESRSALQSEIQSLESNKATIQIEQNSATDYSTYKQASLEKLKNDKIVEIDTAIDTLNSSIEASESKLLEINKNIDDSEIRAPINGTVTLIDNIKPGNLIQSGTSLCSIVPSDDSLEVLLYIPESDVAKINVGGDIEYSIDALPYEEYGKIYGNIVSLSKDTIIDEDSGNSFYIAVATLSSTSLADKEGKSRNVQEGMLLEARCITGSKKVIIWLLEKINLID